MKFSLINKIALYIFFAISVFTFNAHAITETFSPQINMATLSGANAGNTQSFELFFGLSALSQDANINYAKLTYNQNNNSVGLLRIVDKYTGEVVESRLMTNTGIMELNVLNQANLWSKSPSANYGLVFQASAMSDSDSVDFNYFKLEIDYVIQDKIPPMFLDQDIRTITTDTAEIYVMSDEPTYINIYYGKTSLYGLELLSDNVEAKTEHLVTLTGLTIGQTYHYKVEIIDTAGNSIMSSNNSFETKPLDLNTSNLIIDTKIPAPENFRINKSISDNKPKINLSWNEVPDQRVKGYIIYRSKMDEQGYVEYKVLGSGQTSYEDYSLEINTTYSYYIRAFTSNQLGTKTDELSAMPEFVSEESTSSNSTLRIFLIVLSVALIILFLYYLLLKRFGFTKRATKDVRNLLKEPEFFHEN